MNPKWVPVDPDPGSRRDHSRVAIVPTAPASPFVTAATADATVAGSGCSGGPGGL